MIETVKELVAAKADTAVALAKEIWGYAELSYEETKSAAALIAALKAGALPLRRVLPESQRPLPLHTSAAAASRWWAF